MKRGLARIKGLTQLTLVLGGCFTVTDSSPHWGRCASELFNTDAFSYSLPAHVCPTGPGATVHVIVTVLKWLLVRGPKKKLLWKDKGEEYEKDDDHSWKDDLVPGHSQSWSGTGDVLLEEKKGIQVEVTTKETLNPFSLGLSGAVVRKKSCVKVEAPWVHQSCPRNLWKAVSFLPFSMDSCFFLFVPQNKIPTLYGWSVAEKGLLFVLSQRCRGNRSSDITTSALY